MTSGEPRVSVVVPVYNGERYLGACIDSVLAQTAGDFELIVSDNASTDRTPDIAASFGDPRIRYRRNETNMGAVPNWNAGMAEARGRYLKLLCADDVLYAACLEREAAVLDDPSNAEVSLVTAVHDVIDESGRRIMSRGFRREGRVEGREAVRRMVRGGTNFVGEPSGALFRADAWRAAGPWDEASRYVVDVEMWVRLLLRGDLFVIGTPLSAFRVQRGSWSNELKERQTSDFRSLAEKLAADPGSGVGRADVALATFGAWRNSQLRRVFYKLYLSGPPAPAEKQ